MSNEAPEPPKIKGYKPLSEAQIKTINFFKDMENNILSVINTYVKGDDIVRMLGNPAVKIDKRWLAIAKTHFEEGFMALNRSIARPDGD